jgi:hypothetical protein
MNVIKVTNAMEHLHQPTCPNIIRLSKPSRRRFQLPASARILARQNRRKFQIRPSSRVCQDDDEFHDDDDDDSHGLKNGKSKKATKKQLVRWCFILFD